MRDPKEAGGRPESEARALSGQSGAHGHLDTTLARAESFAIGVLERLPPPVIPDGFAARVTAAALRQPALRHSPWRGFGMRIALVSGVALTLGLFAFAPHAQPSFSSLRFDVEMLLLGELSGVAYLVARLGLPE